MTLLKEAEQHLKTNMNTVASYMNCKNVQPVARVMKDGAELITLSRCAAVQGKSDEICYQGESTEKFMTHAKMLRK